MAEPESGESVELERPRLAVVTPYHPGDRHFHAAGEVAIPAMRALAQHYRLTVIAPRPEWPVGDTSGLIGDGEVLIVDRARYGAGRLFGRYPAGARKDWTRRMTEQALDLLDSVQPDRLHIEYLQPVEVALRSARDFTVTLHDVGSQVYRQRIAMARNPADWMHRSLEWWRVSALEQRVVREAKAVATLSERDRDRLGGAGAQAMWVRLGVSSPTCRWSSAEAQPDTAVFAGALWRDANSATVEWLAREVWPEVVRFRPNAELRIVGHGAPTWLVELCGQATGVSLVGSVPVIACEYQRAALVLAPSMLEAGVLLKALSAMAQGVPVVLNTASAEPIGVNSDREAIVADGVADFARSIVAAFGDPIRCASIGDEGRRHVERNFSWSAYGNAMKAMIR